MTNSASASATRPLPGISLGGLGGLPDVGFGGTTRTHIPEAPRMTSEAVAAPPVTLGTFLGPIEKAETAEEAVFAMGRLLEAAFKSRRVTVIKDDVRAACKVAKDKLGDETWIAGGCAAQFRALFVRFKRGEGEVERLIGAHVYIATGWGVYPGRVTDYIEEAEAGGGGSRPVAALGFAGKFKAASAASIGGGSGGGGGGGGGRGGRGKGGAEKEGGERDENAGKHKVVFVSGTVGWFVMDLTEHVAFVGEVGRPFGEAMATGDIRGIGVLMDAARDDDGEARKAAMFGCAALRGLWLSPDFDMKAAIAAEGGIERVIGVMERFEDDYDVQVQGCGVLRRIALKVAASETVDYRGLVAASGGIEAAARAMANHADNRDVQEQAVAAITNVVWDIPAHIAIATVDAVGLIPLLQHAVDMGIDKAAAQLERMDDDWDL